jgi:pyruvate dehydrogenase E2 component (dihydrolipoamide acetyltransferase)
MAAEVIMPKAGMAMDEGTVVQWYKQVGDPIEQGEAVLEILTDKVNMDVEAEASGVLLAQLAKEGDVLPVFTVIGYIGAEGEAVPDAAAPAAPAAPAEAEAPVEEVKADEAPVAQAADQDGKLRATPAARKIARDKGLDLSAVAGTGAKGRIHAVDVLEFRPEADASILAKRMAADMGIDLDAIAGSGARGRVLKKDIMDTQAPAVQPAAAPAMAAKAEDTLVPYTGIRKVIGDRMQESFFTAPHATLTIEIDMTKAIEMRKSLVDPYKEAIGEKPSFNDMVILAVAKALKAHPGINATLTEEGILQHGDINLGFAAATAEGMLVVPVIRNADQKDFRSLVVEAKDLGRRAVKGKILPDEMQGSTFTISNLGMFGITEFTAIINRPNAAILSVGAIIERCVPVNGEIAIRSMMNATINFDHRIIDGAPAAKFLKTLKQYLENPYLML